MNMKLMMVGFLLMGSGIWGAQKDQQVSQALQQEIKQNRANMFAGFQMLATHNIVLNEYHATQVQKNASRHAFGSKTKIDQVIDDSKYVIGELKGNELVKCSHFCENNKTLYYFHQGEWLTYNFDSCDQIPPNEVIIFNIFPARDDQSVAGNLIAMSCKRIKVSSGLGTKILINTDAKTDVETALKSFFNESSWARVPESEIILAKKNTYSFNTKVILGGSIAALVALLCYLRWGR